jgi:hypothetical protein
MEFTVLEEFPIFFGKNDKIFRVIVDSKNGKLQIHPFFFGKGAKLELINKLKIRKCKMLFDGFGEMVAFL